MKKITIINACILSIIASNTMALGTVAERKIIDRLSMKPIYYKEENSYEGHINKRRKLGETLPFKVKTKNKDISKNTLRLPIKYNAVINKRLKLSENYQI